MAFPPTDWMDFVPAQYAVGAPATAASFEAWFRNPVAAFQGAIGAPRLEPKARASALIATASGAGTTAQAVTDLGGYRKLIIYINSTSGTGAAGYMMMAGSTDNGVTWGANIVDPSMPNASTLHVDLDTGAIVAMVGPFTIPSLRPGCNALRWSRSVGDGSFRAMVFADEGRDDV